MYKKEFSDLVNNPIWEDEFIGYGNPNADILIIGQEAADKEGSDNWRKFYRENCKQWRQTIIDKPEPRAPREGEEYKFPNFVPSFPFKPQKASIKYGQELSGPTYYWYQQLIDTIFGENPNHNGYIDFFEKAFITELNGKTRKNHSVVQKEIKEQIAHRFDLMKATHQFWSHFKVVLFLCGSYAKAIDVRNPEDNSNKEQKLYSSIFGQAVPFYGPQFSGRDRTRLHPKKWIEQTSGAIIEVLKG